MSPFYMEGDRHRPSCYQGEGVHRGARANPTTPGNLVIHGVGGCSGQRSLKNRDHQHSGGRMQCWWQAA
jgi:hypothetical protein